MTNNIKGTIMTEFVKKIVFIGGGNMAEAVLSGLLRQQTVSADDILVTEKLSSRRDYLKETYDVETSESNSDGPSKAQTVFLAVKPQILSEVKDEIKGGLTESHTVISILAGMSRERLGDALGFQNRMVRVMPNLPALVGRGVSAITFPDAMNEPDREWVRTILRSVGEIVEVEEPLQDVVTAVSGSGPGYIFNLADLFIAAGVAQGLQEDVARRLVVETLAGSAEVLRTRPDSPAELVKKVATPGGTTEAGLSVLEERNLGGILIDMVAKAAERSRELNKG